jgi:hypothetical protein
MNVYINIVPNPEGERPLGRSKFIWVFNVKRNL